MSAAKSTQHTGQNMQTHSNGVSKYKNKLVKFLQNFYSYILKDEKRFTFFIFASISAFILTGYIKSLKSFASLLFITVIILRIRLKSFFVATLLVALFSLMFFNPNKYYTMEVVSGRVLKLSELREGYFLGYGMNLSNIYLGLTLLTLFKEIVLPKLKIILIDTNLRILGLSALLFGITAALSTAKYSPFSAASFTWLLQYSQMYILAVAVYCLHKFKESKFVLVYLMIVITLYLESVLGLGQFMRQAAVGLPIEHSQGTAFYQGLDEINTLYRISGTFVYHNQLALLTVVLLILIIPYLISTAGLSSWLIFVLGNLSIVMTQSRSIWIAYVLALFILARFYKTKLKALSKKINLRTGVYVLVLMGLATNIIVPRILLSFNSPFAGAGIPIRQEMIQEALEALLLNPWVGYGVGTNEYLLHALFPNGFTAVFPAAVHMAFLQLVLEAGIIGLGSFLFPFIYILRSYLNNVHILLTDQKFRDFGISFVLGCLVFLVYYLLQPHVGIIEFPYLGLVLAFGMIATRRVLVKA